MGIKHKNPSGYTEYVDRLPVPGCCCNKCLKAEQKSSNRAFPANNGTVNGQSAYVQQSGDRTVAYESSDQVGKIVTNDGLNASYVRDDTGKVIVNDNRDDPYEPYQWERH